MSNSTPNLDYKYLFKILLVGDSGVGKTSLLLRFTIGDFKESIRNTVGVDLKVKMITVRNQKLKLTIWDTAGQERFRTLTSAYYRGAHGIILVYDISERSTFENLSHWLKEVDIYSTNESAVKLLIGNKCDCSNDRRQVLSDEGREFARQNEMLFIEASAKTNEGIKQAFDELIEKILDEPSLCKQDGQSSNEKSARSSSTTISVGNTEETSTRPQSCGGFCA